LSKTICRFTSLGTEKKKKKWVAQRSIRILERTSGDELSCWEWKSASSCSRAGAAKADVNVGVGQRGRGKEGRKKTRVPTFFSEEALKDLAANKKEGNPKRHDVDDFLSAYSNPQGRGEGAAFFINTKP